jgi:hypothetical protein
VDTIPMIDDQATTIELDTPTPITDSPTNLPATAQLNGTREWTLTVPSFCSPIARPRGVYASISSS